MAALQSGIGSVSGFVKPANGCLAEEDLVNNLVYLLNSENEIIAYTYTDQSGNFSFESLGFDTYLVSAEVTGKSSSTYSLALAPENPSVTDVILEVGCESFVGTRENQLPSGFKISNVYPQPATSGLTVDLKGTINNEVNYILHNIYGINVLSGKASGSKGFLKFDLNVSDLSAGIYLLQINEPYRSESVTKKIIVK
jgi:hypothetical protein